MVQGVLFKTPKTLLSYTFILHQTTTFCIGLSFMFNCLIPLFYIKPQRVLYAPNTMIDCLIPLFYIKPQLHLSSAPSRIDCIIPLFYIKPQLRIINTCPVGIVLYLYSTSNHNLIHALHFDSKLYYTFILHQTTTEW